MSAPKLHTEPTRPDLLTSRECAAIIGNVIGGAAKAMELEDIRRVVVLTALLAGRGLAYPRGENLVVRYDDRELVLTPPDKPLTLLSALLGGLLGGLAGIASAEAIGDAWQWWAERDDAWNHLRQEHGQPS